MLIRTLTLLFVASQFVLPGIVQAAPPARPSSAKSKTSARKTTPGKSPAQLTSAYLPKVKAALGARWGAAVTQRMSEFSPGSVDVTFKLDADGKVTDFAVKENTSNELFSKFCDQFVRETAFEAPPAGALTEGQLEIPFTFTIH